MARLLQSDMSGSIIPFFKCPMSIKEFQCPKLQGLVSVVVKGGIWSFQVNGLNLPKLFQIESNENNKVRT